MGKIKNDILHVKGIDVGIYTEDYRNEYISLTDIARYRNSDDREHITWFSFEGEFAGDYPACLDGRPAQTTIEAMMSSRIFRVSGGQLLQWFRENGETMELRAVVAEHLLFQARRSYLDSHRTTARERYELLMRRCPGIVQHLPLAAIASFLNVTPQMLSKIRKDITFDTLQ